MIWYFGSGNYERLLTFLPSPHSVSGSDHLPPVDQPQNVHAHVVNIQDRPKANSEGI